MWINLKPLHVYGAKLRMDYTYTPPEISNEHFKGRNRSSYILLASSHDLAKLSLPIVFEGSSRYDAAIKKSKFEGDLFGKSDIILRDDFRYFCYLESVGEASYPSESLIETTYQFKCIRHGKYKELQKNTVYCESTLPHTDCVLTTTVGTTGSNYKIGTVVFKSVKQGERLTVDGINKRILVNGAPAASRAEWITFPSLVQGTNNIVCKDVLTVGYYPVYF